MVTPVWENELDGLTFAIDSQALFIKWMPKGCGMDLTAEADRLRWASRFTAVPTVVDVGSDQEGSYLVMTALPGENAVSNRWKADPSVAVRAIGDGLRSMHGALPVLKCPFSWSAADRLADARSRAANGFIDPARWHPCHRHLSANDALDILADIPEVDQLVVCHGDACAPNTLLNADGVCSGHVDLGALGIADRWADLAIATWSTEWNYGPGWENLLLDAYGVAPDDERIRYYRLLWDLGP